MHRSELLTFCRGPLHLKPIIQVLVTLNYIWMKQGFDKSGNTGGIDQFYKSNLVCTQHIFTFTRSVLLAIQNLSTNNYYNVLEISETLPRIIQLFFGLCIRRYLTTTKLF